ncbi:hypothetical protein ABZ471_48235, partial [Streptomyces sp. NPDC005728]
MDVLTHLSRHSTHQAAEPLDQLAAVRAPAAWHHNRYTHEVFWELFVHHSRVRPAARRLRPTVCCTFSHRTPHKPRRRKTLPAQHKQGLSPVSSLHQGTLRRPEIIPDPLQPPARASPQPPTEERRMSEDTATTTELTSQYISQVTSDLERNV